MAYFTAASVVKRESFITLTPGMLQPSNQLTLQGLML
jgi:hypothetical protein